MGSEAAPAKADWKAKALLPGFGRGWIWLVYIDLALPAVLYALAFLLRNPGLSNFFHIYGLYIVSPAPVGLQDGMLDLFFRTGTGIPGLLIQIYAAARAALRRDRADLVLCLLIALALFAFFFFELNYDILRPLDFSGLPG